MQAERSLCIYNSRMKGEHLASKMNLNPSDRLLSVLRRWFCCYVFIVWCCSHCLWGLVLEPCIFLQYFVSFSALEPSSLGRVG